MHILRNPVMRLAVVAALLVATLWFAGGRLAEGTSSIDGAMVADNALLLGVALVLFGMATMLLGAAWIVLIEDVAPQRGRRMPLMLAYIYAWLVRYVPGTVPFFAGKVYLGQRAGYKTRSLVVATGVQNLLEVLVSGVFGAVCIALALGLTLGGGAYALIALLPALGLIGLHPAILRRISDRALRAFRRDPLPEGALPSIRSIAAASALTAANQTLCGAAMLLLMNAVTGAGFDDLLLVSGALSLAGVAGILVVLAPAGLGVRDGALTGLLALRFAVESAALAALLLRATTIIADVALVVVALCVDLLSGSGVVTGAFRRRTEPALMPRTRLAAEAVLTEQRSA